jgi:hypothetical protein
LCCFFVLCAFASLCAEQVEIMNTNGTVEVMLEGSDEYTAAEEGMILEAGDTIKTSSGASAELSFNEANTNVVRLNENTDSKITLSDDEKMDVSSGEVFASVSDLPSGSAFEIRTPTAVSGARGTDWVTKVTDDGTDVEAVDSIPYVKHFETGGMKSDQMTLIQPGQMTTVKKFQPPMQSRPMNSARQQEWQSMKQQVRQRADEAVIRRQQRPQFNRQDFIQQMKGKRDQQQSEFKALRSDDMPKKPFDQQQGRLDDRRNRQGISEGQTKQPFEQQGRPDNRRGSQYNKPEVAIQRQQQPFEQRNKTQDSGYPGNNRQPLVGSQQQIRQPGQMQQGQQQPQGPGSGNQGNQPAQKKNPNVPLPARGAGKRS